FRDHGPAREILDPAVPLELQPDGGRAPRSAGARPGHEREIEARRAVRGAAVEVEPLRPRIGPRGRVRDRVEAVHRAQQLAGIGRRPGAVAGRARPTTTRSPPPRSAADRDCSRITSPTPSSDAMTATPKPKPPARTAVRTGRAASVRSTRRRVMAPPPSETRPAGRCAWPAVAAPA